MDHPSKDELSLLTRINLIFRFSYTLPFLLASVCGVVYSIPYDVPWHILVLIPLAVLLLALFVNFSNDYFDHKSGVDRKVSESKSRSRDNLMTPDAVKRVYWDGNQFDTGLVTESQGRAIMAVLAIAVVIISVPIILYSGWPAIVFGLVGAFLAFFYTAPPVNLGARGLGEVSVGIAFFMMCFCSFYVATGTFTIEILLFSMMVGVVVGLMRLIDSMSANDVHLEMGEVNMSIRLGAEGTVKAIRVAVVLAYVLAALTCYYNLLNLLLFLTLPVTFRMVKVINSRQEHWDVAIIPLSFLFSLLTEVMFLIASVCSIGIGPVVFW